MRILLTTHTFPPEANGVAHVVSKLAAAFTRGGNRVEVATNALSPALPASTSADNGLATVAVHRFDVAGSSALGITGDAANYRDWVTAQNFDVVVMHCLQTWSTDALLPVLDSISGVKILVTHGLSGIDRAEFANYYEDLPRFMEKFTAWVTLSDITEESRLEGRVPFLKRVVIPNGVDTAEFAEAAARRTRAGFHGGVLNVSNHNPNKGHSRLRDLSASLPAGAVLRQVGRPYPAARGGLGQFGVKGGCWYACRAYASHSKRFNLYPNLTRREVVGLYLKSDVFALPSNWEAAPLVILEAMAAGLPWVATDVGNLAAMPGGMVVAASEFPQAVAELLNDDAKRVALGSAGAQAAAGMDWAVVAQAHLEFYESLLDGGGT